MRKVFGLEDYITMGHVEAMNKVIVLTGSVVGVAYLTELFMGWYSQNKYEGYTFWYSRANLFSPYGWSYWGMMACNVLSPQIFWFRKMRRNLFVTFFMSVIVHDLFGKPFDCAGWFVAVVLVVWTRGSCNLVDVMRSSLVVDLDRVVSCGIRVQCVPVCYSSGKQGSICCLTASLFVSLAVCVFVPCLLIRRTSFSC